MAVAPTDLLQSLEQCPLFSALERQALEELVKQIRVIELPAGSILFQKGDDGDCLYIVAVGQLAVFDFAVDGTENLLKVMGRGEYLGEIGLLRKTNRTATVRAQTDAIVIRLSRSGFERFVVQHPGARALLERAIDQRAPRSIRPPREEILRFLAAVPIFRGLDASILSELVPALQWMTLAAGEYLFRQKDPADALYVVLSGRLRILVETDDGTEQAIGEIGRGQCVGEFGLLTDEPRSATVRPLRDTELLRISKEVVDQLFDRHPRAMLGFVRSVVTHARVAGRASVERGAKTIALVPKGRSVSIAELVSDLTRALSPIGVVAHATSALARSVAKDAIDGSGDPLPLIRWMNELEATNGTVLYVCDPKLTPWTHRCLRQADRILLIDSSTEDPEPGEVEQEIEMVRGKEALRVRTDLALIHPAGTRRPTGTDRWLLRRRVDSHHHIRERCFEDIERMERRLSGRSVGLVLSGGASHGFAHIGVVRALREQGIPIDQVAGTSMGAVIAAEVALGWDEREMIEGTREIFANLRSLIDITLPVTSLLGGQRFAEGIHEVFGDTLIEDLWLGYFCVSGNLTRGVPAVHASGSLSNAVITSCSIPGVLPPVVFGTDLHVDGGVANNLPDDVMRARGQGPVIAVDVGPSVDLSIDPGYSSYPPGWKVLAHGLNPFGKKVSVPTLFHILFRTAGLSSHAATERARAECALYLKPKTGSYNFLDFSPVKEIAEEGYQSTKRRIAEWKASRTI